MLSPSGDDEVIFDNIEKECPVSITDGIEERLRSPLDRLFSGFDVPLTVAKNDVDAVVPFGTA